MTEFALVQSLLPGVAAARAAALAAASRAAALTAVTLSAAEEAVPSTAPPPPTRSYLIWEHGFAPRFLGTFALLVALAAAAPYGTWRPAVELQSRLSVTLRALASRLEWWSLLGLLSSSCCLLQLMLNTFSVGCAGFNTLLGPLRPYLAAFTLFLHIGVWRHAIVALGLIG